MSPKEDRASRKGLILPVLLLALMIAGLPVAALGRKEGAQAQLAEQQRKADYIFMEAGARNALNESDSYLELLRAAQHNEHEEHGSVYPSFAAIATQEGFPEAAASFRQIAAIEQLHGERFGLLADQLESGALFVSQIETGWMCLNCGHTQNSLEAPKQCPVCNHGQGWFIRLELAPWSPVVKQT